MLGQLPNSAFYEDAQGYWIEKDPQAILPYTVDWYEFLRGNDLYWQPNLEVHVNETATPSQANANGRRYKVLSGGMSGEIEPVWPTTFNATVIDGTITWQDIGVADTISASAWTASAGITASSSSNNTTATQTLLTGGTAGTTYDVDNKITTALGYVDSIKFRVVVKDK